MSFEVTATRKRPASFETLVGQEFVVSTLKNALSSGHIAHAYLFAGPRGVGKTSSARLLAKALNCQNGPTPTPCGRCEQCISIAKGNNIDVIEIDGASNTGVSDIRVIKEEVMFPPTSSRYKIYIIDEVHMLSQSAFNALLKTIEEPPEYIIFIFATTELQKVPATIRSRCQQFNFRLLNYDTIKTQLKIAADESDIRADDDALFWIAKESTGSMRDAYTLFDQVASFSGGHITMDKIRDKLGIIGLERINMLMNDIIADRQRAALEKINSLLLDGVSIDTAIKDFAEYFRNLLVIKRGITSPEILGENASSYSYDVISAYSEMQLSSALDLFLNLYRDIRYSLNPRFELELAISKLGALKYQADNAVVIEQIARLKNDLITGKITPLNKRLEDIPTVKPANASDFMPKLQSTSFSTEDGKLPSKSQDIASVNTASNTSAELSENNPVNKGGMNGAGAVSSDTGAGADVNAGTRADAGSSVRAGAGVGVSGSAGAISGAGVSTGTGADLGTRAGAGVRADVILGSKTATSVNTNESQSATLGKNFNANARTNSTLGTGPSTSTNEYTHSVVSASQTSPSSVEKDNFGNVTLLAKYRLRPEGNGSEQGTNNTEQGNLNAEKGNNTQEKLLYQERHSSPVLYSREDLKNAIPQGVGNVVETQYGIELQYESKFLYHTALKDLNKIKEKIQSAVGQNVNVTISFSEELANKRLQEQKQKDEIMQKERERLAKAAYNNVSDLDSKDKSIFNEFLHIFKGREEK